MRNTSTHDAAGCETPGETSTSLMLDDGGVVRMGDIVNVA